MHRGDARRPARTAVTGERDARLRSGERSRRRLRPRTLRRRQCCSVEARSIVDRCVDPGIAGRYLAASSLATAAPTRPSASELVEELTDRELAVLRYLPSRLSQREIAGELYVSLNTVKTHCKAIYRKLGVDGRKAAVQAARDHGLL